MPDQLDRLRTALSDRYAIDRELGRGGMATVYLAHDLKHERKVAVKVLRPELAAAIGAERFLREIKVTANLQHPHILPLFDSGEADGLLYYVMPFVAGESLRDKLDREGRLSLDEALVLAKDVAGALTHAYGHGVVHRDIKPENILVGDGEALVADFGIALAISSAGGDRLTSTGLAIGTPAYMSPEQISGERALDGRSDVYALACVVFEMLMGQPPFTGPTGQAVMAQGIADEPPSARGMRDDLPAAVDAALTRALSKGPEGRFDTPRAFVEACALPSEARTQPRGRLRLVAALLAVAVLAAAVPLWRGQQRTRATALLPQIAALAQEGRYVEAYELAVRAERRIGGDSVLDDLLADVSDLLTITSTPAGARVAVQRFPSGSSAEPADTVFRGATPVRNLRLPRVDHRVAVRMDGFAPLERVASSGLGRAEPLFSSGRDIVMDLVLSPVGEVPPDMVRVPGGRYEVASPDMPRGLHADLADYAIDRFEVTNAQFREFIVGGGYATPAHWRAAPVSQLVDRTGLPGPRSWVSQEFPDGQDDHPVTDVTRYEASAYCRFVGKRLPTVYEWEKAARDGVISHRGFMMPWGFVRSAVASVRRANFSSGGTVRVDAFPFGISAYGAYAMAGNAKEWMSNRLGDGFAVSGGSWQDPMYLYSEYGSFAADVSSPGLGFRCARTDAGAVGDQGTGPIDLDQRTPTYTPVDADTYRSLLTHYRYDRQPLDPRVLATVETADWTRLQLGLNGVGGDSVLAYLYLPLRAAPPFQTIVVVPHSGTFYRDAVWEVVESTIGPHIKAGRAALAVVFKGMVEREWGADYVRPAVSSVRFRDEMVRHATELRRGIDYLETRDDIDLDRLAYFGISWGSGSRLPFAAVDDRFKGVVLIGGGIDDILSTALPEASTINFAPYIRPPKLLLNGRQDEESPWYTSALPLWNLLREPKELVLVDGSGHLPPPEARVPAVNRFLDATLGPVRDRSSQ